MAGAMAQSHRQLVPEETFTSRSGKYRLDELDPGRIAKHLAMFSPNEEDLPALVAKARLSIPGIAKMEEVFKVVRHNPGCILGMARRSRLDPENPIAEGFVAILPLNALGLRILALGSFNGADPDLRLLAGADEKPAGIYLWCVFLPGSLAAGMALMMERLSSAPYEGVDIYARTLTEDGRRFSQVLGFKQGVVIDEIQAPDLWIFPRKNIAPLYDSYIPHSGKKSIGVTIARTFDDLMRVAAIRNAVYIGEQECPYEEEYDGNDLSATHLLAYMGDEPVGCMRLRFFADFAKFERVAVRKEFRQSRAAIQLIHAGLKFCQKKGYARVIGHAQSRLAAFWTRFGFRPMENRKHFVFSDYDYVEMVAELERDPDAITIETDPYIAIRPEGRWHVSGILEQSSNRPASNPYAVKRH
jgi:predicted GNAT family N-acyltransferase